MNPYFAPTEAELLSHSSFLEELSCSLVADPQTADDIVQDTWLAVLQHPPAHSINPIGWLSTVARNLARRDHRTRSRQSHREREVARPEGVAGHDSNLDRTQSLGRVAAAVEALPEPYRTVVFLRFFENLMPREIAEQLDVGLPTIKSQLHRGLDRLRSELEEDFGRDGADWRGVLCGCFGWQMLDGSPVPASVAATSLSTKSLAFATLLLLATGALVITLWRGDDRPATFAQATTPEELTEPVTERENPSRQALAAPVENTTQGNSLTTSLLVAIVDEEASPVAGATLWMATRDDFANVGVTDALGQVRIATGPEYRIPPRVFSAMLTPISPTEPRIGLMATADHYCASRVSWIEPEGLQAGLVTLVLPAHGFRLIGKVLDEDGNPVPGTVVERHDTRDGLLVNGDSDLVVNPMVATRSDAFGRFEFPSLATGLSWLRFKADGFAESWARKVVREESTVEMEVRLQASSSVSGVVADPNGLPVSGARVWATTVDGVHEISTVSDDQGAFRLTHLPTGDRYLFARGGPNGSLGIRMLLRLEPGVETSWYPNLLALPRINLELVDLSGVPLRNQPVHVRSFSQSRMSRFDGATDENGRLSLYRQSHPVRRIDIYFSTRYGSVGIFPDAHLDEVASGEEVNLVEVDTSRIVRGSIEFGLQAHDGRVFPEVTMLARSAREERNRRIFVGRNKSQIRAVQVVPDELKLVVSCTGLGNLELGTHVVESDQTLRLPDLIAPTPGTLRIDWRYAEGGGEAVGIVQHLRQMKSKALALRIKRKPDNSPMDTYELFPGDYSLKVHRNREPLQTIKFTIRSGFETLIEVDPAGESKE